MSGPTIENINLIKDKAKTKNDGVYSFRGVVYRVHKNKLTHYAYNGKILELYGYFCCEIGVYEGYSESAKKALKTI